MTGGNVSALGRGAWGVSACTVVGEAKCAKNCLLTLNATAKNLVLTNNNLWRKNVFLNVRLRC